MYVRADRLVLLKNALLLGVSFKYGYEVAALQPPPASSVPRDGERPSGERESSWTAWVHGAASTATHQTANDVLAFKPQKDGEYTKGVGQGKCNQLQASTLDATFARAVGAPPPEGASAHRFDALLLSEGEWSPTCKKLGITKSIDRFSPAIGLGARSRRVIAACARGVCSRRVLAPPAATACHDAPIHLLVMRCVAVLNLTIDPSEPATREPNMRRSVPRPFAPTRRAPKVSPSVLPAAAPVADWVGWGVHVGIPTLS